jgi:ribonuclease P protein component
MQRRYRLTSSSTFKRVRRIGKSYAHPLVVLIKHPNELDISRFGIAASRTLGNAIERNRAKRRLRESIRPLLDLIVPGWDIVVLARRPLISAQFSEIGLAIETLLKRAALLNNPQ